MRNGQELLEFIGARWTGAILWVLKDGEPKRFNQMLTGIAGISARMLTERLMALEAHHLVERRVTPSQPVHVDYRLTERGKSLLPIIGSIYNWIEAPGFIVPAAR